MGLSGNGEHLKIATLKKKYHAEATKNWIPYVQTNPYCLHQFGYAYLPKCVKFTEKSPKTTHDQKAAARQQNYV